ncbi:hypothetical protein Taro_028001 [Colocasia esculenta]|uniref:Uncharacterized protein n=1 Tax=Colocasia esculenta TaxID=4460 RepID=A0A843VVY8_COLES|nr:hypothetical protein [Colocasia esculenta]
MENSQDRIRVSAGFMARELGVNIVCRQDLQSGGEGEEDVSRPTSSSGPRRSGAGSVPPAE